MDGGDGMDTFLRSSGNDTMDGGLGDDFFGLGLGQDIANGGAGNDAFFVNWSNSRSSSWFGAANGGDGVDMLKLDGATDAGSVKVLTYGSGDKAGQTYIEWKSGGLTFSLDVSSIENVIVNGQIHSINDFII